MADEIDVLLYGLGAIGSFYAYILSLSPNVRLTLVARSNYEAVKQNGLTINSELRGDHSFRPHNIVNKPADAEGHYDFVVCAHKAIEQDSVPQTLCPVVDGKTTIVLIQNGVGNEAPFRATFPKNIIITCVTWVGAAQPSPGIIKHNTTEHTQLGLFSEPNSDAAIEKQRLDTFVGLLNHGKSPLVVEENMQIPRWEKVVWNCAWNSITTLTRVDTQTWLQSSDEAVKVTRQLMREVIDVARKIEVPLSYDLIDEQINKILAMPGITSSMANDARAGRPLELDVIVGVPVKRGRELGVPMPTLEVIYAMLSCVDFGARKALL